MTAAAVAVTCVTAMFAVAVTSSAGAADDPGWPVAEQNISDSRASPNEAILSPSPVGDLKVAWTSTTRGPVSATPAVADGAVYVPDWGGYKVDAETEEVIWSRSVASYVGSTETVVSRLHPVVGDTVHIGTQTGARLLATPSPPAIACGVRHDTRLEPFFISFCQGL